MYGQVHPVETPKMIIQRLEEFDQAVQEVIPEAVNLQKAQQRCPDLLTDEFKLMFLRSEVFRVDKAVKRYIKYWDKRSEIFGNHQAFQPLTLKTIEDSHQVLLMGAMNVFYCQGRCMAFVYPKALDRSKYTIPTFLRAFWYMAHVALENEETIKKGIVVVGFSDNISVRQLDVALGKACIDATKGILPVRFSAYHITHPSRIGASLWPLARPVVGEKYYNRFRLHLGSREKVLQRLESYGMSRSELPSPIGGEQEMNIQKWMHDREMCEEESKRNNKGNHQVCHYSSRTICTGIMNEPIH